MTRLASWQNFGTNDESAYPELWRGCVGAWAPCLGPTGTRLHDLSRYENWGTLTNMDAATDWVVNGGRYGLDFDAVDDVVRVARTAPAFPFTVTGWINSRSDTANQFPIVFCRSTSDEGQFSIRFAGNVAGDTITCRQEGDAGGAVGESSFTGYVANQWYAVAAVFRSNNYRLIYVNGVAGTENTTSVTTPSVDRFAIGRFDRLNPAVPLDGLIDDVMIYSRELLQAEIRLLATRRGIAYERRKRKQVYIPQTSARRRKILTGQV